MLASTIASCIAAWLVTLDLVVRIDLTPWLSKLTDDPIVAPSACIAEFCDCGDVILAEPGNRHIAIACFFVGVTTGVLLAVLCLKVNGPSPVAGGNRPRFIVPTAGDRGSSAASLRGRQLG